jgi:F420-dependent methylenetetrahydromethanopterin dehydrogenase
VIDNQRLQQSTSNSVHVGRKVLSIIMDSPPESPPHPKTAYEILRDQKKAEMLLALEPVLRARREL